MPLKALDGGGVQQVMVQEECCAMPEKVIPAAPGILTYPAAADVCSIAETAPVGTCACMCPQWAPASALKRAGQPCMPPPGWLPLPPTALRARPRDSP